MPTVLKARQGTLFQCEFAAFHPIPGTPDPDLDNPYDFTDNSARLTVQTPQTVVFTDPPNVVLQENPAKVSIFVPATITEDWSQGDLNFEVEIIPPAGEDYAYALVYGVIRMERQSA